MSLFTPDLFRNFAIGFVVGLIGLGVANAADGGNAFETPALAANALEAPAPGGEFVIEQLETSQ